MDVERLFLHRNRFMEIHLFEGKRKRPHRLIFRQLKEALKEKTVILYGVRGVGKTVLLLQLVEYILNASKNDDRVIYISVDHFPNLEDTLKSFLEYHGFSHFESVDEPLYIFLDEVHYFPGWDLLLKKMHDASDMLHVFSTGSSSIRVLMSPDLYRRAIKVEVPPLFFYEYLLIKAFRRDNTYDPAEDDPVDVFGRTTKELFVEYLLEGGFPFFGERRLETYERVRDVVDRVLWKDIGSFIHPNYHVFLNLLHYLAYNVPGPLSYDKISQMVGISKSTVEKYMRYLTLSGLLLRVEHCKKNRPLKPSKYYFVSPTVVASLRTLSPPLSEREKGTLLETYVASLLKQTCYLNSDFYSDGKVIEVGWTKKQRKDEVIISMEGDGIRPWEFEGKMYGIYDTNTF